MTNTTHYRCSRDLLPTIEAALTTNGYTIAIPFQKSCGGAAAMILANGGASVLLGYPAQGELAEIQVWGDPHAETTELLDSLCRVVDGAQLDRELGGYTRLAPQEERYKPAGAL